MGGSQIDMPVGDVEGKNPAGSQVASIQCEGLRGQQVQRYCVAGEGIDHQDVELLPVPRTRDVRASPGVTSNLAPESRM